uniref:Uncharacterized protein n=1 Tax=Pararge aegeria TaxID=116150 RepID=S4NNV5_9NEOP
MIEAIIPFNCTEGKSRLSKQKSQKHSKVLIFDVDQVEKKSNLARHARNTSCNVPPCVRQLMWLKHPSLDQ